MLFRYGTLPRFYKPRFVNFIGFFSFIWLVLAVTAPGNTATDDEVKLLALGDSLTAGFGLAASESFPQQLEKVLRNKGYNVSVQNAGVSGDTSAGGLARLGWATGGKLDGVILELGANDALRATPPESTRKNIDQILTRLGQRKIDVLLAGMLAPPNLGQDYGKTFNAIFPDLAASHGLLLYPFFLEGVAGNPSLTQADGLHPTAAGIAIIVQNILPKVEELLKRINQRRNSNL